MEICPPEREAVGGQPTLHVDGRQRKSTEEKWEFDKYYKHGGGDDRNDVDAPGEEKGNVGGVDETGKQRRSRRRWSHLCFYLRFCSKNMLEWWLEWRHHAKEDKDCKVGEQGDGSDSACNDSLLQDHKHLEIVKSPLICCSTVLDLSRWFILYLLTMV